MAIRSLSEVTSTTGYKIDPTKFERDLVRALNGVTGYSHYQSKSAEVLAHKIAAALRQRGATGEARQASGQSSASSLTPVYREHGVKSGEPKADILVGAAQCSMKYAKAAQIATAQANETQAVFAAAFQHNPDYTRLIRQQIIPLIQHTMTRETFYKIRDKYSKNKTEFQNMLSQVLSLHSSKGAATTQQRKAFRDFLSAFGVELPVRGALYTFLDSPSTKQTLFHEFVTGANRFVRPEFVATHVLTWDETGRVGFTPATAYVEGHLNAFQYSIRDRGSRRAGAFRLSVAEELHPEWHAVYQELTEHVTRELGQLALDEGLLSDMWAGATEFITWMGGLVKQFIAFLIRLFQSGLATVMEWFEYEVGSLSWTPTF